MVMDNITELFNKFDEDKDNYINIESFKRLINILNINPDIIIKENYSFEDVIKIINDKFKKPKIIKVKVSKIKESLREFYDQETVNFFIFNIYGNVTDDTIVCINKLDNYKVKPK